ncbi:hypothetical protein [Floridanema evergladense]|uniref:Uncharacterized protein n=1 Tax=Floridaenema evergladense BLCC-F167 TaxID=3153639 RepID=A0ABV4WKU2_9CYAN
MNIILLPAVLPGDLDLAAINQQLKNKTAQLDWSSVVSAPERHLAILLEGLNLVNDAEVLDLETSTMSDTIAAEIIRFFNNQQKKTKKLNRQKPSQSNPISAKQGNLFETQFVPSETQETEGQGKLLEMQFVPVISHDNVEESQSITPNLEPPQPSILPPQSYYQIRAELEQAVLDDLLGPAGGEYEEIDEMRVSDRYLVGLVAPTQRQITPEEREETPEQMDELAVSGSGTLEEGTTENNIPLADKMFPSALGMTFCVEGNAKAIKVTAGWGQYEKDKSESVQTPTGEAKTLWRRYPIKGVSPNINLQVGAIDP